MSYRPEIDGLRAIAVGAVIAVHAGAPLRGGFLGVDIFFVISGFLITGILAREMAGGRFSLAGFYERRARRILPALLLVVTACLPAAWIWMTPDQLKLFGQSLVAVVLFVPNMLFWRVSTGYFAPAAEENPLLHTWSLGVEEQFYVFFPLLLLALWRLGPGRVTLALAGLLILSLGLAEWMARTDAGTAFYLLPFRAWELLAGALAALAVHRFGLPGDRLGGGAGYWHRLARWQGGLSLAGLGLIAASLVYHHAWLPIPGIWLVPPVAGTVLVLLFARPGTWAHWCLTRPAMIGLGLISYSAYLWHQPLFAFARLAQFEAPGPFQMAGLVALTLVLAWASWRFVEKPCRQASFRLSPLVWAAGTGGAALVALGLAAHLTQGFGPQRFAPETLAILDSAEPSPKRRACHRAPGEGFGPEEACVYFADTPPTWAVLGDSHAVEIAYALGEGLAPAGESLVHLSLSGCPPALGFEPGLPGCAAWTERVVAWLEEHPRIHTVVLAYRHNAYLFGRNDENYPRLPNRPYRIEDPGTADDKRARYWAALKALTTRLAQDGRRVVFVEPVPELGHLIGKHALFGAPEAGRLAVQSRAYYDARNAHLMARLDALPVERLSARDRLCDGARCYGVMDGEAMYFDADHLSLAGARRLVAPLVGAALLRTKVTVDFEQPPQVSSNKYN